VRAKLSCTFCISGVTPAPGPMPLGGIISMKSAEVICVCWKASWKKTSIFWSYSGNCIHPSMSPESAVGSAVTACTSASVGGSPTRMFLTLAT
jgi:hypothetical protein